MIPVRCVCVFWCVFASLPSPIPSTFHFPLRPPPVDRKLAAMVYITSDLFGLTTTHDGGHSSMPTLWPTMASPQHTAGLGKRKRHDGEEGPSTYVNCPLPRADPDHVSSKLQIQHRLSSSAREATRPHTYNHSSFERSNVSYALLLSTPSNVVSERRPVKQPRRLSPKATLVKSTSHLMDIEFDLPATSQQANTPIQAVSDLRSCHACKLAPKRKKDLVNYLDCKRCDGRTCYICARQCVGGCGKAICKKCIVEVGQEGDSWCLDCYAKNLNS